MQNDISKEQWFNAPISNVSFKTDEIRKAMDKGDYDLAHKLREERNFDLNNALKLQENISKQQTMEEQQVKVG